ENSCVRENLKRALADIAGQEDMNWCWFESALSESAFRPPYLEDFLDTDIRQYRQFLMDMEKEILAAPDPDFEEIQDRLYQDIFFRISLFLKSYIACCRARYLPPVIVFENADMLDEKAAIWLAGLIRELPESIPVLLSGSEDLADAFAGWEISDIAVADMTGEELDKKLPGIEENKTEKQKAIKLCEYNPDYLFYYSLLKTKGKSVHHIKKKDDIHELLIGDLDHQVRRIFFIISCCSGFFKANEIIQFCQSIGIEDAIIDSALDELSSLNIIELGHTLISIRKNEMVRSVTASLKNETDEIENRLIEYIGDNSTRRLFLQNALVEFMTGHLDHARALDILLEALMYCIERREIDYTQAVLRKCMKAHSRKMKENQRLGNLIAYVRLQITLVSGDEISAANIFPSLPGYLDPQEKLDNLVLQGKYHNAVKNYRSAMTCLKSILVKAEEHEQPLIIGKAYLELGLSFLGLRKLEEAKEYFFIAQEHAARYKLTYQYIRALILHSAALQFIGNYSEAVRLLEEAVRLCEVTFCRTWQTIALFLLGRTKFELGEYDHAITTFQRTMTNSLLYDIPDAIPVSLRWMARCFAFEGKYTVCKGILEGMGPSLERDFLLAECFYFEGDIGTAAGLLKKNAHVLKAETFRPSETVVYTTGYSMVEDFSLSSADGECVLSYLDRAFTSYVYGLSGAAIEASADLFSITREDKLSDIDPNIHLYYLFATLVNKNGEEAPALDKITLLSKGLKILQERASEIDSPQERRSYLTKNKWNNILFEEARKYKLA
ncbi:MAG: tetratricopeptide repeat protein, partial [Spirochaetales bacterium]|nr:tetratricopeptide repeat protein [Spirochaetales bacterium]